MSGDVQFGDFIRRIRLGDEAAAEELVRRFESVIRREVRSRLEDSQLARTLDSVDISQSVLASFFARMAAGEYDLYEPPQLTRLLVKMAKNKLASQSRRQFSQKREARRVNIDDAVLRDAPDGDPSPSQHVSGRELLDAVCQRLTDEERRISDLRSRDLTWEQIAAHLGGTPDGRRMQLTRALDRITHELGLQC
jgi:RNA polymerase sigma factor (sigma-70 family)